MSTTAKLALATALAAIAALGYRATRSPAPLDPGLRAARAAQAPASAKPATPRGTRAPQARAGVAAPAAEELAPMAASGTAQASLSVRVVRAGDGARVSDAEVLVLAARDSEPLGRAGARVGAGDSDRDGRARIEVPPGHAFVVSVHPRASSSTPRDPLDVADVTIDALAPDEQRELTVALPHGLDGQFALRVVDAAGGAGIEGAEVRVRSTAGEELLQANGYGALRTDASGRLSFPWATWRPERLAIHAAGFGVAIVDQGSARPDATGEVVVPLRPAALVVVRVAPPEPGLEVRVACHDAALVQPAGEGLRGPLHWSAATDAAGAARLVDLPAGVRLQLSLWRGEDFLWGEPSALVLESGERRALSWTLDAGTRVEGYVLDPRGRGVADAEVWLVAQSPAEALGDCSRQFGEGDGGSAVQRASTDGSGRYLFAAVAPGSWWVGVGSATGAGPDGAARALTRPARRLVVARGDAGPATVTLNHEVDEGLFIHGVVLGTEGEPLDGLLVSGRRSGDCSDRTTRSSGGGRFRLGPLEPGRYFLHAFGGHGFLRTAGALAAAGSEDPVELRVRRGGEVTGRVLDASGGQGVDAHVTLTTPTGSLGMDTDQVPRGGFLFTGLGAGTFAVQAVTRDGRVGISEAISLTAERPDAEVEVVLGPSAFVELVLPADAAGGRAYLETADLRFVNRSIEPGDHVREAVPAGRVRVVMVTHVDGEWATVFDREVEVEAGTTRRVDLGER